MNPNTTHALLIMLVTAAVTFSTRLTPFLLFRGGNLPKPVAYLGKALPPAVMGMLIVYCLRGTAFTSFPYGLPQAIAIAVVVLLHLWKHNNLLSILGGTAVYMALVQVVFA